MTLKEMNERLRSHVDQIVEARERAVAEEREIEREIVESGHVPRKHWQARVDAEKKLAAAEIVRNIIYSLDL